MIKERIIQLLEKKGIGKEEFYVKIGMTSASFRGNAKKTPLNSNAIENLISIIPDVNPDWLLTGRGNMIKEKGDPGISTGIIPESFIKSNEKIMNAVETIANSNKILADTNAKLAERILELTNQKDTAVTA